MPLQVRQKFIFLFVVPPDTIVIAEGFMCIVVYDIFSLLNIFKKTMFLNKSKCC